MEMAWGEISSTNSIVDTCKKDNKQYENAWLYTWQNIDTANKEQRVRLVRGHGGGLVGCLSDTHSYRVMDTQYRLNQIPGEVMKMLP